MIIFLAILGYPVDSGHSMGEPESSGAARYARRLMMKRNLASAHKGSRLKSASDDRGRRIACPGKTAPNNLGTKISMCRSTGFSYLEELLGML